MTDEELKEIADLLTDGDIPLFDVPGYINQLYEGIERLLDEVARLQAEVLALAEQKEALASELEQARRRADGQENRAEALRIALTAVGRTLEYIRRRHRA